MSDDETSTSAQPDDIDPKMLRRVRMIPTNKNGMIPATAYTSGDPKPDRSEAPQDDVSQLHDRIAALELQAEEFRVRLRALEVEGFWATGRKPTP